jgi:hypothetical protein
VTSWREEASTQTQEQLDELLDVSVRAAQQQLDRTGAFYPFGVALAATGGTRLVTPEVRTGPRQVADVAEVYEMCWAALRADADALQGAAVVADVGDADGDAIAVALEHREGPAVEVLLPYALQGKTNGKKPAQKVLYGDLRASAGQRRVWP